MNSYFPSLRNNSREFSITLNTQEGTKTGKVIVTLCTASNVLKFVNAATIA